MFFLLEQGTPDQREEVLRWLANGETHADVARTYNVDASTIGRLLGDRPFHGGVSLATRSNEAPRPVMRAGAAIPRSSPKKATGDRDGLGPMSLDGMRCAARVY
jgi:hypothetical protein